MKYLFFLLISIFVSSQVNKPENSLKNETIINLGNSDTIKFDEIVYYKINQPYKKYNLKRNSKSSKRKLKYEIIYGSIPRTVEDTLFVKDLEKYNYHKIDLNNSNFKKIAKLYESGSRKYDVTCKLIFRDILVFKKSNKIVGISKICFGCGWETTYFNEHFYNNLIPIDKFVEFENLLNSK